MTSPLDHITDHRIIPVVVIDDAATAATLGDALVDGGLPLAEITFRTSAAPDTISTLADRGDLIVGAGTITSVSDVDAAVQAGASFLVSPGLSQAVVERAAEHNILLIPGAVTATEVQRAVEWGVRTIKFFPAETSGGIAAIRALSAPFPAVSFIPTGGVTAMNLADYLALPSVVAVGGSWMVERSLIATRNVNAMTQRTTDALRIVRAYEKENAA
ncbi:bifunctional 4-hydroxy-2-oxoglutarate aldolase/2-dehydro-3-deoxy-phosphogluconate aldolase [Jonesia denitrificans]|uniref:2-dehydro-3-deoxy-phosphogluconate aldolase n=1 Tax=Jonesia denitrificans (strain ATCC 14870 / DSM 20603 / BCRC 15368 / CIP 55.134 / JCM 11481 / NBRC 15587 / NCTC 10816 / Prevot 55134) TaxID=471856 RepID=C7R1L1_JONDD|nr:bifunctional 4-hydroxy-2-oxoglutarate aldolase/2-dehydro-3-deoxy-phosphogluconate aldolase [Jonesia denitrificans]ACV09846.1 2-dehydro-3-deoxyphosphogluconate aldolase/4- hydroxy-2-oxoglutarate aldolase [Jonesia denitrificans DSM 20603]AVJ53310.1 keto-deoxy-phosphogluconate aldolase [Jonesia denitrificans]QXB43505.1 bifunctional 4-hydroxy-2-oxoglutarate aldolase/2-dehydro-3-deoxy-phosphogluconate aldolase [Jonesia denitrificans]SQH22509.1 Putative KHG/KDPG aldolase [Jonesia denitrificans]